MGKRIELTEKQERQIISFFENSHFPLVYSDNIDNSCIMALFRACRDYLGNITFMSPTEQEIEKYRVELIEKLKIISIRYYMKM